MDRDLLLSNCDSIDALEIAAALLNEAATFDVGKESFLNTDLEVGADTMVTEGNGPSIDSVAAIRNVLHPMFPAHLVLKCADHAMLMVEKSVIFARYVVMCMMPSKGC